MKAQYLRQSNNKKTMVGVDLHCLCINIGHKDLQREFTLIQLGPTHYCCIVFMSGFL